MKRNGRKLTYNEVVADLNCANEEVQQVMDQLEPLKREVRDLKQHVDHLEYQLRMVRTVVSVVWDMGPGYQRNRAAA